MQHNHDNSSYQERPQAHSLPKIFFMPSEIPFAENSRSRSKTLSIEIPPDNIETKVERIAHSFKTEKVPSPLQEACRTNSPFLLTNDLAPNQGNHPFFLHKQNTSHQQINPAQKPSFFIGEIPTTTYPSNDGIQDEDCLFEIDDLLTPSNLK